MALVLQQVPANLQQLSSKLGHDADIRGHINALVTTARAISDKFSQAVRNEGTNILQQKADMMAASSPGHLDMDAMHNALQAARLSFIGTKRDIVVMQADVHVNVEKCRARKMAHEQEIREKEATVSSLQGQINGLTDNIATYDKDAQDMDNTAKALDDRASDLRKQGKKKAILNAVVGAVGVVLMPFTAGASGAVALMVMGVNLYSMKECLDQAKKLRGQAREKRDKRSALWSQSRDLSGQKTSMRSEVDSLRESSDELGNAARCLSDVTSALRTSLEVTNSVIETLQDAETAFKEAQMQGKAFQIIQNAYNANPEKLGAVADTRMNKLMEKLVSVENLLITYGARMIE